MLLFQCCPTFRDGLSGIVLGVLAVDEYSFSSDLPALVRCACVHDLSTHA